MPTLEEMSAPIQEIPVDEAVSWERLHTYKEEMEAAEKAIHAALDELASEIADSHEIPDWYSDVVKGFRDGRLPQPIESYLERHDAVGVTEADVITGLKRNVDLVEAMEKLYPFLADYHDMQGVQEEEVKQVIRDDLARQHPGEWSVISEALQPRGNVTKSVEMLGSLRTLFKELTNPESQLAVTMGGTALSDVGKGKARAEIWRDSFANLDKSVTSYTTAFLSAVDYYYQNLFSTGLILEDDYLAFRKSVSGAVDTFFNEVPRS